MSNSTWLRVLTGIPLLATGLAAGDYYASPDGNGDGSFDNPMSIQRALGQNSPARGGDTIWLRGGTYRGPVFASVGGTPTAPVVVRAYAEEWPVIDGKATPHGTTLDITGPGYVWFQGFEVTNSDPNRSIDSRGSNPTDRRGPGVYVRTKGVKIINMVIHDTGEGITAYRAALDLEAYGNIVFNNGWSAPDRTHGHGIYAQNETSTKIFRDNVVLKQYGDALHVYGSENGPMKNMTFIGNVFFYPRLLIGGGTPVTNIVFEENMTLDTIQFGYGNQVNRDAIIRNNYFGGMLHMNIFQEFTISGNTFARFDRDGGTRCIAVYGVENWSPATYRIDRNSYLPCARNNGDFRVGARDLTFAQWKQLGFDSNGSQDLAAATSGRPAGPKVFLRKNLYDPTRALLVVYNWQLQNEIKVDVSGFLAPGEEYELRNVEDYFNDVSRAKHDGPVAIRMTGRKYANPIGYTGELFTNSIYPRAGIFIIRKLPSAPAKPAIRAVVNGASRQPAVLAPGLVVTVLGENLGPDDGVAGNPLEGIYSSNVSGTRLFFDGVPAPVLYANAEQVNAVVPFGVAPGKDVTVVVERGAMQSAPVTLPVAETAPALFTVDFGGAGPAVAINEDGSLNGADNAASADSVVRLFATGLGVLAPLSSDGRVAVDDGAKPRADVKLRLGGRNVNPEVVASVAGAVTGVAQVLVRVPQGLTPGAVPVVVSADGQESSASVTIAVR